MSVCIKDLWNLYFSSYLLPYLLTYTSTYLGASLACHQGIPRLLEQFLKVTMLASLQGMEAPVFHYTNEPNMALGDNKGFTLG